MTSRPPIEAPTMRLATLRRLVSATNQVLTYDQKVLVSEVADALRTTPGTTAVIIDDDGVLVGTVRLGDLRDGHDPASTVAAVMFRNAPIMTPDTEVSDALAMMSESASDRVLVVSPSGELLGILTDSDLDASRLARGVKVSVPKTPSSP
jgi:CBS domain-containing protein